MTKMSGVVAPAVLDQNLHLHWGREVKTEREERPVLEKKGDYPGLPKIKRFHI